MTPWRSGRAARSSEMEWYTSGVQARDRRRTIQHATKTPMTGDTPPPAGPSRDEAHEHGGQRSAPMPTKITMPQLGESVNEGTIGQWLKQEGETVKKDEAL